MRESERSREKGGGVSKRVCDRECLQPGNLGNWWILSIISFSLFWLYLSYLVALSFDFCLFQQQDIDMVMDRECAKLKHRVTRFLSLTKCTNPKYIPKPITTNNNTIEKRKFSLTLSIENPISKNQNQK